MIRFLRVFGICGLAVLCASPAVLAQAQATTGVIEGTAKDEGGGVLPGVTVTLTNTATNFEKELVTDASGRFRGVLLPLGPYRVTASLEGFATLVREGLELALGQTINLALTMQISQTREEILVTATSPLIEVSRTEGQVRIDDRAIEGLPNNGRNFLEFTKLTPGVTIVQGPDGDELSINGQKGINNNVSVDGADFNNPFFGEQRGGQRPPFTFNIDAVKEVLIVTDGAPAEFGRSSGGFINVVTKSGTNDYRGSAHLFFKNDGLSESPQNPDGSEVPSFDFEQAQAGFTLGGPLQRDRAFFFVAADTQDGDTTKQTNPARIEPRVVQFLADQGMLNENGPITRTDDADAYLAKLDWQVSDTNLLTLRAAYTYSQQVNGTFDVDTWGRSANGIETDYSHALTGTLISTLSDSLLNEFRGQYAKEWRPRPYAGPQVPGQNRPFPDTAFDFGGGYRVGMPFFLPIEYDDDRIQINNNLSILKGDHSIKAGVEYNDVTSSQTFIGFANGRYIFSSTDGFINYVNNPDYRECPGGVTSLTGSCPGGATPVGPVLLFLQFAGVGGRTAEDAGTQGIEQRELALFVQDQWQPSANLTVEYGIRFETLDNPDPITPASEVFFAPFIGQTVTTAAGPQTFPSDGNIPDDEAIQPRLAVAWTPGGTGQSILRGTAGIYAARVPALTLASTRSTNGTLARTIFHSHDTPFLGPVPAWPNLVPEAEKAGPVFFPDVFVFDRNFEMPKTLSLSLSYEREVKPDWAVLGKINYAKTDHITRFINRNDAVFGSPWSSGLPPAGINGIFTLTSVESTAKSRYQGYTVGVNKRYSNNYQLQAYYTYSKDESDDDNERDPFSFRYARADRLDAEFGLSDRDQKHRFNAWLLWDAPWGINVNVRLSYRSAQPKSITATGADAATPQDRINADGTITQRNLGRKDNEFKTLDLRLAKDFQVGNWTLQPIVDIFNLTNEANFLRPEVTNLIFNFDGTVRSGAADPREIQIGVRILK